MEGVKSMDFSDMLKRANLNSLQDYFLYGGESTKKPSDKTYSERLKEATKNATAFFKARYPDIAEYDEIAGYFGTQAAVFQEVYFEIGLIVGANKRK
jgi:hypothetical protein